MANIIDTSYFVEEIEIPNLAQAEIASTLQKSIDQYEKEVLIDLLGYPLYKELQSNIASPTGKWDKLINGEEFTFSLNGETIETKWEGLKGFNKKSLISYFVYFMHRKKHQSYNDGLGIEVEADTENSSKASLYLHLVDIWNEFVKMYGNDPCEYYSDSGSYVPTNHYDEYPSAYNYLLAKKSDFPTWRFVSQEGEINMFGI